MISVNGEPTELRAGATVAQVLARLGVQDQPRGVAVAVDGEVVPRRDWQRHALDEGAHVEVLTAMQGG
jgi:sulfur carrier protein